MENEWVRVADISSLCGERADRIRHDLMTECEHTWSTRHEQTMRVKEHMYRYELPEIIKEAQEKLAYAYARIREYEGDALNGHDLKYWCNALGELCWYGASVTEEMLPDELRRAYHDGWSRGYNGLCYLTQFTDSRDTERNVKPGYKIALVYEFNTDERDGMPVPYRHVQDMARCILRDGLPEDIKILCGDGTGFGGCHEIILLLPADCGHDRVDAVDGQVWKLLSLPYGQLNV